LPQEGGLENEKWRTIHLVYLIYPQTEILFPHRSISALKGVRGGLWQALVDRVAVLPETHEDSLAFSLMMIRLCDCVNCDLGSYKASLGCSTCARRTISAIKGSDTILMRHFEKAKEEVLAYLESIGMKEKKAA
jgi:hypothetical protein